MEDTICAISTAMGVGGISIIRVSGSDAISIVNSIFKGKDLSKVATHTIHYGHIMSNDEIIDEVLVSIMLAPKTYTTEDVVEINLHGGIATTNRVLQILLESGCRLAEPGEFTKRAFLNGRIDLVQAEAVSDIINAETESAREVSINQITGSLSSIVKDLKSKLLELEANIEVNIDYPEYEDIEDITGEKALNVLSEVKDEFKRLIEESKNGKILKNGINVALIGKPNVGKSSILNKLIEEDKAIVTDIEGTTRDIVEGKIVLNGVLINFIDTAGIRETDNVVEKIGVDKSKEQIELADLIILVLIINEKITSEEKEILERIRDKKHIIFVNKCDLESKLEISENAVRGNTLEDQGLDYLKNEIIKTFELDGISSKNLTYISNARQLSLIKLANDSVESAIESAKNGLPVDVIIIDIRNARNYLSDILGENYNDELLDELFSRFCLGK